MLEKHGKTYQMNLNTSYVSVLLGSSSFSSSASRYLNTSYVSVLLTFPTTTWSDPLYLNTSYVSVLLKTPMELVGYED